ERKGQIGTVFLRQRRDWQGYARHVDALAIGEPATDYCNGLGELGAAGFDAQSHLAVIEQQLRAWSDRGEDLRVQQRRAVLVAGCRVEIEPETGTGGNFAPALCENAEPQLRPLQVGHDTDGPSRVALDAPDNLMLFVMFALAPVAEIQTEDVDTRVEQGADRLWRGTCRTE